MVSGEREQVRLMTIRCAVIGHPISHSLSPALHLAAYAALGLDWEYERRDVTADQLAGFLSSLDRQWRGLSVTMPLKQAIRRFGTDDRLTDLTQVANTLVLSPSGNQVHNTDVTGLIRLLRGTAAASPERATLLGAGASARSVLVGLAELGCRQIEAQVRTPSRAAGLTQLADRVGVRLEVHELGTNVAPADLLISTLPPGAGAPYVDAVLSGGAPVVLDLAYAPWPGPLVDAAVRAGRTGVDGLQFLAAQAVDQIRWFTGREVDIGLLVSAGLAALSEST